MAKVVSFNPYKLHKGSSVPDLKCYSFMDFGTLESRTFSVEQSF